MLEIFDRFVREYLEPLQIYTYMSTKMLGLNFNRENLSLQCSSAILKNLVVKNLKKNIFKQNKSDAK